MVSSKQLVEVWRANTNKRFIDKWKYLFIVSLIRLCLRKILKLDLLLSILLTFLFLEVTVFYFR